MPTWQKWVSQEWLWGKTEPWKTLHFKRLPRGWIFRSPVCWWPFGFGPHAHYFLDDTQEIEIEKFFRNGNSRLVIFLFVMMLLPVPLLWFASIPSHDFELRLLIGIALYILYVQAVFNVYYRLGFRRVLAGAVPTSQRIGFAERYGALAANMPSKSLIFVAIFCAAFAAIEAGSFVMAKGSGALSLVGVLIFGFWAVGLVALLLAKRRANHASG